MSKFFLVLIPGLLSSQKLWQDIEIFLQDIVTPIVICTSQNSPQKMVDEILNNAPDRFILCGHSMGGWLSLELMRRAPSRVLGLCLVNSTSRQDSEEKLQKRLEMIRMAKEGRFVDVVDLLVDSFVFNEAKKQEVRNMFLTVGKDVFISQQQSMIKRLETFSVLSHIAVPSLVIHAQNDRNFLIEEQKEMVNAIGNAKLGFIENCGHMSPLEAPQALSSLLRFWLEYDCLPKLS